MKGQEAMDGDDVFLFVCSQERLAGGVIVHCDQAF